MKVKDLKSGDVARIEYYGINTVLVFDIGIGSWKRLNMISLTQDKFPWDCIDENILEVLELYGNIFTEDSVLTFAKGVVAPLTHLNK